MLWNSQAYVKYKKELTFLIWVVACSFSSSAFGVGYKVTSGHWTYGVEELEGSLNLPLRVREHTLNIPTSYLLKRAELYLKDPRIEPVYVNLKKPLNQSRKAFVRAYARSPKHEATLLRYLTEKPFGLYKSRRNVENSSSYENVVLSRRSLDYIDLEKFRLRYRSTSYDLTLPYNKKVFSSHSSEILSLIKQTRSFLGASSWHLLRDKIRKRRSLNVSKDLLPPFAQKVVQRYFLYRGLNCFHAAMAFQEEAMLTMAHTNLREEASHHHLMINHDELWHILNWYFYEIDPQTTPLNYGDVVVFFDLPKDYSHRQPPQHQWIVHAHAYLFNGFVFSKGSKSPNTPYSIKTMEDEWQGWSRRTQNLALKVFRRSFKDIRRKSPVVSRTSWLY